MEQNTIIITNAIALPVKDLFWLIIKLLFVAFPSVGCSLGWAEWVAKRLGWVDLVTVGEWEIVCFIVGIPDGHKESDGADVGDIEAEGAIDGTCVGLLLGLEVGIALADGATDGFGEGFVVGVSDGREDCDGISVGLNVGFSVGRLLGNKVGENVGLDDVG